MILVDTADFEDIVKRYHINQEHLKAYKDHYDVEAADDIEKHAAIISEWSGLEMESVKKMLKGGVDTDFSLTSKINGLIKEEQKKAEEKKKKAEEEA